MDDRLLLAQIDVGISRLEKSMRRAGVSVDGAAKKMATRWEKNNRKMAQSSKVSARAINASLGTIGVGAALAVSVRTIAQFRQSMSTVKAITGATADQFAALENRARDLGATTRFSASEAAEGMIALGRAGFNTDQVLASIEGTLLLAQSGALELGQAADIASNVLQGFQLGAEESARAVDVLSLAANSSNTNVEQLGQALSFVAPAAAAVGVSLEDTTAAVSVLSNAGIQATRAGTGLRKIFIDLASKGHDFSEEAGGVEGILKRLNKEFGNLGKEQRLVAASDLVGARQASSLLVLLDSVKEGTGQLAILGDAYENAGGSAKKFASVMDDNLNGALLSTKSRLEEMIISLGEAGGEQALIDALQNLQNILVFVAENADTFNKAIIILTASMAGLIGGKALAGGIIALKGFSKSLVAANVAAGTSTLSIRGLTLATRTFLAALGPVGLITIAAGAIAALAINTKSAKEEFESYDDTLSDITKASSKVEKDTLLLRDAHEKLAIATRDGGEAAVEAKALEINAINARLAKNKELIKLKRELAKEQLNAGKERARGLENKKNKITSPTLFSANDTDQANRIRLENESALLDVLNKKAANNEPLTKREKKFRELRLEILEHNIAMEEAAARIKSLDDILNAETVTPVLNTEEVDPEDSSNSDDSPDEKDREKERREKAIESLREIGKAEIEQIEDLRKARLEQIAASQKANEISDTEAAKLRVAINKDAAEEIRDINEKTAEDNIQHASDVRLAKADELQLVSEIAASVARMRGRAVDAVQIEMDATRARYQAELDDIDRVAEARAASGLEADPQLAADRANAQAGIAGVDADQSQFKKDNLEGIRGISDGAEDGSVGSELARIQDEEKAKNAELERFRTEKITRMQEALQQGQDLAIQYNDQEIEQLRSFEDEKAQIEAEFSEKRKQLRLADINSQLDAASGLAANIGRIGKEGSKAQKAAAIVQKGIAIGRATVNTALAVSEAAASAPFPFNVPSIAFAAAVGAAQVGAITAQSFDGGGDTGSGPRSGGVDGKGGKFAIVHPDEVIADMTKPGREVAGKSLQQAFGIQTPNVASPNVRVPSFTAARGGDVSIGGMSLTVQGNVTADNMPAIEAKLDQMNRNFSSNVNAVIKNRERRTQTRTKRMGGVS